MPREAQRLPEKTSPACLSSSVGRFRSLPQRYRGDDARAACSSDPDDSFWRLTSASEAAYGLLLALSVRAMAPGLEGPAFPLEIAVCVGPVAAEVHQFFYEGRRSRRRLPLR